MEGAFLLRSNKAGNELCLSKTKPLNLSFKGSRTGRPEPPGLLLLGLDQGGSLCLLLLEGFLDPPSCLCLPLCLPPLGNILGPLARPFVRFPLAVLAFAACAAPTCLFLPLTLAHYIALCSLYYPAL